ncbi:MAG: hypothetical protein ABI634_14805 [Acidobacteriota bacterium]
MYEPKSQPLLPFRRFLRRMLNHFGLVVAVVVVSLAAGMVGYVVFARMSWVDAFVNTAMLLGGMGPIGELPNDASKIFAGCYALYAGLVFILSAGVLLAPIVHRILHKIHADKA